jgi:hypothetical protein
MSLSNLITDFYVALFAYKKSQWHDKAVHAAAALGIDDNTFSNKEFHLRGRYPTPHRKMLRSIIAKSDDSASGQELRRAAQNLLDSLHPGDDPYVIVTDLPPQLKEFAESIKTKTLTFRDFERMLTRRAPVQEGKSSGRDLLNLSKVYTHTALQLETGAFVNNALAFGCDQKADLDALEAYAMADLIAGFTDLRYFQSLAAAARKTQRRHAIPVHPLGVIELSYCMREVARPTDSEELRALRRLTTQIGRSTAFLFYDHNDRRPLRSPKDIVAGLEPHVAQSGTLYNFLHPAFHNEEIELPEPMLVCAGAAMSATRLALSLICAANTLLGLGHVSPWLEAVASKVVELALHSSEDLIDRMHEAFNTLRQGAEMDRAALEREFALTATALFREEGARFIFNDNPAFVSKCGSVVQSFGGETELHRFLVQGATCQLPAPRKVINDPIWVFHGAACS